MTAGWIAISVIGALVAIALALFWIARLTHPRVESADETLEATTADGWRIAVSRWKPRGPARRRHPVLLCPGLAANRFSWDLAPEVSIPRHLSELGWDVFCVELRGHGHSERPRLFGKKSWGWSLDHHAREDVPAAIELVRRTTGSERVHYVGHSMGGILGYTLLARGHGRDLRSVTTIGSSLDYSSAASDFHLVKNLTFLRHAIRAVPLGFFAAMMAPLTMRFGATRLDEFNVSPENTDPRLYRRLTAVAFHSVSTNVLVQLATCFHEGGLCSFDRATRYGAALAQCEVPVLAIAGTRDRQCHPDAARGTVEACGGGACEVAVFGREHGHAVDYGHFDLLMGRRAREDVWPVLARWLERHDDGARARDQSQGSGDVATATSSA